MSRLRTRSLHRAALAAVLVLFSLGAAGAFAASPVPPGPPFPEPEFDRAVYDQAGIFRQETIDRAEAIIDAIEARTGVEIVVYTQVVGYIADEEAERHAIALMDQWGVGRAGFDDGLVILFDLEESRVNGLIELYAGPGYRVAYLSNDERDEIFRNDMVPYLRQRDMDGALLAALAKIDANATPERAAFLERARQADAVMGLIVAPALFLLVTGWGVLSWRRHGKDPTYVDSDSIHIPAPPPDLTAAAGALVMDGQTSRRALTAALLDLASRGLISFREESARLGLQKKVGIDVNPPEADPVTQAWRGLNARRPISAAEKHVLSRLERLAAGDTEGYIKPDDLLKLGPDVPEFDKRLETHATKKGWFRERPSKAVGRWAGRGTFVAIAGAIALFFGIDLPSQGLVLVGAAGIASGIVLLVLSRSMGSVTKAGAMIRVMLNAYRRTLQKTMAQARSMQQVVAEAGLDWLETPDQAVVWGTALGLQAEIEQVLKRTLEDVKQGRLAEDVAYTPRWYTTRGASAGGAARAGGSLFSSSAVPNFGGMMNALGTIGNSPSSSGSGGGGGGFSGGSSGGGGGGAGGRF
jgi:uncharacterized membrane protein YgcG